MIPTADQMARIIIAAARETGADPLKIDQPGDVALKRARAYAALAVRQMFPKCQSRAASRMVGMQHSPYAAIIEGQYNAGSLAWLMPDALGRVRAAVGDIDSGEDASDPLALPEPKTWLPERNYSATDFIRPKSKRDLERELREAVINTAKMGKGD